MCHALEHRSKKKFLNCVLVGLNRKIMEAEIHKNNFKGTQRSSENYQFLMVGTRHGMDPIKSDEAVQLIISEPTKCSVNTRARLRHLAYMLRVVRFHERALNEW